MIKRLFFMLFALFLSFDCFAGNTTNRYQIDMIIFSRINPKALNSQFWRSSPSWKTEKHIIQLAPTPEEPLLDDYPTLTLLPTNALKLNHASERLTHLKDAKILSQIGWQMTEKELANPITISLDGGNFVSPSVLQEDRDNPNLELTGTITLSLTRYFNTTLHLVLSEPQGQVSHTLREDRNCSFNGVCRFYFERKRRTRGKLLNYIDTPLLGVLIKITPIQTTH